MSQRTSLQQAPTPQHSDYGRRRDISIALPTAEMTASSFAAGLHRLRGRNVASRAGSQLSAQWSGRKGGRHSVVALGVVLLFLGWCAVTQR